MKNDVSERAKNGPLNQRTREPGNLTDAPRGVGSIPESGRCRWCGSTSHKAANPTLCRYFNEQQRLTSAQEVEDACAQESRIVTDQVVQLLEGTAKDMLMQGRVAMCLDAAKMLDDSAAKLTSRDSGLVRDTLHAHAAQFRAIAAKGGAL